MLENKRPQNDYLLANDSKLNEDMQSDLLRALWHVENTSSVVGSWPLGHHNYSYKPKKKSFDEFYYQWHNMIYTFFLVVLDFSITFYDSLGIFLVQQVGSPELKMLFICSATLCWCALFFRRRTVDFHGWRDTLPQPTMCSTPFAVETLAKDFCRYYERFLSFSSTNFFFHLSFQTFESAAAFKPVLVMRF